MDEKDAEAIGFTILSEHHAVVFNGPISTLFEILLREEAFDHSIISPAEIRYFGARMDNYINTKHFSSDLFRDSLKMWKAYSKKSSRLEEFKREKEELSEYTKFSPQRIMEFALFLEEC